MNQTWRKWPLGGPQSKLYRINSKLDMNGFYTGLQNRIYLWPYGHFFLFMFVYMTTVMILSPVET